MTRNMGTVDRSLRAFVVAPLAIVVALVVGAGTLGGVILSSSPGSCWRQPRQGSARPTPCSRSRRTRADYTGSVAGCAPATHSRTTAAQDETAKGGKEVSEMTALAPLADAWGMHDGVGTGWMIGMSLMMVLFWGAIILGIVWLIRGVSWRGPAATESTTNGKVLSRSSSGASRKARSRPRITAPVARSSFMRRR